MQPSGESAPPRAAPDPDGGVRAAGWGSAVAGAVGGDAGGASAPRGAGAGTGEGGAGCGVAGRSGVLDGPGDGGEGGGGGARGGGCRAAGDRAADDVAGARAQAARCGAGARGDAACGPMYLRHVCGCAPPGVASGGALACAGGWGWVSPGRRRDSSSRGTATAPACPAARRSRAGNSRDSAGNPPASSPRGCRR